jgi:hypothetical protein
VHHNEEVASQEDALPGEDNASEYEKYGVEDRILDVCSKGVQCSAKLLFKMLVLPVIEPF